MPRSRKPYLSTRVTKLGGGRSQRIHIPQPPYRPVILRRRDALQRSELDPSEYWFVEHKRGVRRPKVGVDPKEARAVSENSVRGSLPERIVYRYLTSVLRLSPYVDFDFQSSLDGGRLELGGIVADFMFDILKFVIQVQGPTHDGFVRNAKDTEQELALNHMGYRVFYLTDDEIYDQTGFEEKMRKIFFLRFGGGAGMYEIVEEIRDSEKASFAIDPFDSRWDEILLRIQSLDRVVQQTLEVIRSGN